jgi:hypothetical protein
MGATRSAAAGAPAASSLTWRPPLPPPPPLQPTHPPPRVFIEQLSRLLAPGGTLILADFCRKPGELTKKQWKALEGIDKAFASAGNWHSAEQYRELMGGRWQGGAAGRGGSMAQSRPVPRANGCVAPVR